jgi:hypothetical protein
MEKPHLPISRKGLLLRQHGGHEQAASQSPRIADGLPFLLFPPLL